MLEFTRLQRVQMSGFNSVDAEAFSLSHIANHLAVGFWLDRISQCGFSDRRNFSPIHALVAACLYRNSLHDVTVTTESADGCLVIINGVEEGETLFSIVVDTARNVVSVKLNEMAGRPVTTRYSLSVMNGKLCIVDGMRDDEGIAKFYYHRCSMTGKLLAVTESRLKDNGRRITTTEYVNAGMMAINKVDTDKGNVFGYATQMYASGEVDMAFRYYIPIFEECKDEYSIIRINGEFQLYHGDKDNKKPIASVLGSGDAMKLELGKNVLEFKTI
ncbi:hypothetical protein [Vibrio phage vB_pir03]|nr:hypothetical protein [Vibrio phage vB_pir03]